MRLTAWVVDSFQGRRYRTKLKEVQRAVGAEARKTAAEAKRASRAAKRQRGAS